MAPPLSLVVVVYGMAREFPRTLHSLAPDYQLGIDADDYEVVVVDNGSPRALNEAALAAFPGRVRAVRVESAPPSPAHAANIGLDMADGETLGLIIDGARIASPGLLVDARLARGLADRPVIATPAYHLGSTRHMQARDEGYDQSTEDRLLNHINWPADGYRLFEISTLAGSSGRGWFGPMGESSALFMSREMWLEVGGLDERFGLPGGGLVNHDLYRRACGLQGARLIVLLGQGTFHQLHGGAATSRRLGWDEMHAEYVAIRGEPYNPPSNPPLYLGAIHSSALSHLEQSVELALKRARRY